MRLLTFTYKNWRGEDHTYAVVPEVVEFGPYDNDGHHGDPTKRAWVMHARVYTRDNLPRDYMRRTFIMSMMRNLGEA